MSDAADIASEYAERLLQQSLDQRVRFEGMSLTHCEDCEEPIPAKRRELLPGVRRCVECQELAER
ncbi:MAG: TraR/DksA C4-type zinc finger protein [Ectothiorhodospiraceae bacterium]|nr:TraR/DksA C4-type zinc finger protein [Ectothiorhodospiraceae bacterium]